MKREDAKQAVGRLAAAYPNWKVDAGIASVWIEEMESVEVETVTANIKDHIRSGNRFPPSLAEVIQLNPRIEAEKEKERTRRMLQEQKERAKEAVPPPWTREGVSREEWMERVLAEKRGAE